MRTPKGHTSSGLVTSAHVRSRWTRPYHGGYGQSRRARLATAVHVGHVDVASSIPGLGCGPVWMSVHPAMLSILYGSHSSSISKLQHLPLGPGGWAENSSWLHLRTVWWLWSMHRSLPMHSTSTSDESSLLLSPLGPVPLSQVLQGKLLMLP